MPRQTFVPLILAFYGVGCLWAEERVALVIGNSDYQVASKLKNPTNDAAAMADALGQLGFKVARKTNVTITDFEKAVGDFGRSLGKGDVALFFFAGHGLQVKGENFLLPTEVDLTEEAQVARTCYKVDGVLDAMESAQAGLKIVILDSCRDNPLPRSFARSSKHGLAEIKNRPRGTIIAFSTAPGQTAQDGKGRNSPYTKHLVAELTRRPAAGLELRDVFFDASAAVLDESGQEPWLNIDATIRKYYLWRDDATSPSAKSFTNGFGMEMLFVPSGKFTMGSPASEKGRQANEDQVDVTLTKSYFLGQTEVTQGQWRSVMGTEPWKGKDFVKEFAGCAATYVSWDDAQEFCKKLSEKEGKRYRLPSEAEWEYACRGGTTTAYSYGGEATNLEDYAWFSKNAQVIGNRFAHEVGRKKANPFGLHDMHGNLREWCADMYNSQLAGGRDPLATSGPTVVDATNGSFRAYRGGCWLSSSESCRSAYREREESWLRSHLFGFRVALSSDGR